MSFVVLGRPPGTITYTRRWKTSTKHSRNAGRMQTVTRRHRTVMCHAVPYDTDSAAQELLQRLQALGWQDLEVCRFLGDTWVRIGEMAR